MPPPHTVPPHSPLFPLKKKEDPGVLLDILGGVVPPGSPNLDSILDEKNLIFHTRFQIWPVRNYVVIT